MNHIDVLNGWSLMYCLSFSYCRPRLDGCSTTLVTCPSSSSPAGITYSTSSSSVTSRCHVPLYLLTHNRSWRSMINAILFSQSTSRLLHTEVLSSVSLGCFWKLVEPQTLPAPRQAQRLQQGPWRQHAACLCGWGYPASGGEEDQHRKPCDLVMTQFHVIHLGPGALRLNWLFVFHCSMALKRLNTCPITTNTSTSF